MSGQESGQAPSRASRQEISFSLRLAVDGPLEGAVVSAERSESVPFYGWLELMALIDALRSRDGAAASASARAAPPPPA